ncbi:MAG: hypothetical protein M3Y28_07655, partial [Armatimonadota bacterium]|nr:hypothetical protein [Armatimonadota bacterium]
VGLGMAAARRPTAPALVSVSRTSVAPKQPLASPRLARARPPETLETPELTAPELVLPDAPTLESGPPASLSVVRPQEWTQIRRPAAPISALKQPTPRRARLAKSAAPVVKLAAFPPEERSTDPAPDSAWLKVTARQAVNGSATHPLVANVHAERVSVDGSPSVGLSAGGWVRVPPGRHRISFYPPTGGPFSPNDNLHVNLTPGSRSHIQVPLARRVADDTVVGGLTHFGAASGIIKPTPPGGQARGDNTDDNTPPTPKRAPAERGDF